MQQEFIQKIVCTTCLFTRQFDHGVVAPVISAGFFYNYAPTFTSILLSIIILNDILWILLSRGRRILWEKIDKNLSICLGSNNVAESRQH